jgi:hypothetical protein
MKLKMIKLLASTLFVWSITSAMIKETSQEIQPIELTIHNNTPEEQNITQWPNYEKKLIKVGDQYTYNIRTKSWKELEGNELKFNIKGTKNHSTEALFKIIKNPENSVIILEDISSGHIKPKTVVTPFKSEPLIINLYLEGAILQKTHFTTNTDLFDKSNNPAQKKRSFKQMLKSWF